jgi:hypothetical protein
MMQNKLGDNGVAAPSPKCTQASISRKHVLTKHAKNQGKWNPYMRQFNKTKSLYVPRPCSVCSKTTRDYCSCDPGRDLCRVALGGTWKRLATEIKQQLINSSKIWCFLESMFASPAIPDHFSLGFLRCSWVGNDLGYLISLKSER